MSETNQDEGITFEIDGVAIKLPNNRIKPNQEKDQISFNFLEF